MSELSWRLILTFAMILVLGGCQKSEEKTPASLTDEQVVQAIEDYITSNLAADSTFAIEDEVANRTRNLTLDYVHSSVHSTEEGSYYACADMTEGTVRLDLDFYVVAEDGQPKVSEVVIHKVDGVSRK